MQLGAIVLAWVVLGIAFRLGDIARFVRRRRAMVKAPAVAPDLKPLVGP
jgi:hypothetical protein